MQRLKITTRTFALAVACLMAVAAPIITLGQVPPEEQNPWTCYDHQGYPRECTAVEKYALCLKSADESHWQCMEDVDSFWDRAGCEVAYVLNELACATRFLTGFVV